MKFYIKIDKSGKVHFDNPETNQLEFWNKEIKITDKFFEQLFDRKEVLLLIGDLSNQNKIPDYDLYFQQSVDLIVYGDEILNDKQTILCQLNDYGNCLKSKCF